MVTKVSKEVGEAVAKSVDETLKALRGEAKGSTGLEALEQLNKEFDTVNIKINRKDRDGSKYGLFADLKGYPLVDLIESGYDGLCKQEGEAGEYKVEVSVPAKELGGKSTKFIKGPFKVDSIESLPIARSEMAKRQNDPFSFMNPMANLGLPMQQQMYGGGGKDNSMGHMLKYIGDTQKHQTEAGQAQQGTFMNLLGMLMFKDMIPGMAGGGGNGQKNTEVEALKGMVTELKSELSRSKDQQINDERMRRQDETIAEMRRQSDQNHRDLLARLDGKSTDQTLEIMKMQNATASKGDDGLFKFLAIAREDNSAAQARQDTLMAKLMDRPDDADKSSKILSLMMESAVGQLNMMTQIAQSGLAGGGSDSPWVDLAREGVGTVREALRGMFQMKYGVQPPDDEEGEEEEEESASALPERAAPVKVLGRGDPEKEAPPSDAQTEVAAEEEEPVEFEPEGEINDAAYLKKIVLTEKELESLGNDNATKRIFKSVSDADYNQATARIFGAASQAKNKIHQNWMMAPGPITAQILSRYGLTEHMIALGENMVAFLAFLDQDGDANEWSEDYKPIKPKKEKGDKPVTATGPRPDFGVQEKDPEKGDLVDPSQLPDGVDPALAEQQRAERQARAQLAKMREIKENIEALNAGHMNAQRAQFLRGEGLLPEAGQEKEALAHIIEVLKVVDEEETAARQAAEEEMTKRRAQKAAAEAAAKKTAAPAKKKPAAKNSTGAPGAKPKPRKKATK